MNTNIIERFLSSPTEKNIEKLLNSQDTVFWVDWREEDDAIVEYCERILQTKQIDSELQDIEEEPGFQFSIVYKGVTVIVPLVAGPEDRHITLYALNQAIAADFEIRFCIDSAGGDSLAFLPLSISQWGELEERFGNTVAEHFAKIEARPNLFTEGYGSTPKPSWEALARDPSQKVAAIKAYRDEKSCGFSEAKSAIEAFIQSMK